MSDLASASFSELFSLFASIQRGLAQCSCYEASAQCSMDLFYEHFASDLALARTYVTTPYHALPAANRQFVDRLAQAKKLTLTPEVPVLSLVGTRGCQPKWNDRRQSAGHMSIPLASADFVFALPMIARLLADFGVELHWIERPDRGISTTRSGWSGLFHVIDAGTSVDQHQRLIIPAQDFVREQEVRTVFGIGGSYSTGTLFAMIFFTHRDLNRESVQRFLSLATMFKAATMAHVDVGRIFAA